MRKQWLLIVFFTACIASIFSYTACTYDYFVDETNYIVYIPEVKDKTIDGCRVMVYDKSGLLVGDKSTSTSTHDTKIPLGLFTFRLPVGDYKVYCYANTDGVAFSDENSYETSAFSLLSHETGDSYSQPSDVFFDILEHTVKHPGILVSDTAAIERYVGRITVRFKNFPFDITNLASIDLLAEGVATKQYLKHDTLTTYIAEGDVMKHTNDLSTISLAGGVLEVDHRYFPSVENSYKTLNFMFFDSGGTQIARIPVGVADPDTYIPYRLYYGKRLIIEVDRYLITTIQLVGWDEDIKTGGEVGVW
ncbi:FimB/Mfa2 family fimbrial subunit [Bacteroides sp. 51]|uniref:FimB/Mfa2 family fimbrial subunit n=1 Tax=Bacteroides sp. 51 TaxID=2302938 RepID=UPI0013D84F87|nr:FimB/Mfa2 family fimbrial subunit [Bacteroides sp. 51]NDV84133.1 hypothetical protein [Bacteroides sp. 51]